MSSHCFSAWGCLQISRCLGVLWMTLACAAGLEGFAVSGPY
jgi:hypothetical protein